MIIDKIENIGRYAGFVKDADKIAAFFREHPAQTLLNQEYKIEDTGYAFTPVTMEPKPAESKKWEGHRHHTDIHITARGREYLDWIPLPFLKHPDDYHVQNDVEFYADSLAGTRLLVEEGYFVLFLPEDIHKPLIAHNGCGGVKILIKAEA